MINVLSSLFIILIAYAIYYLLNQRNISYKEVVREGLIKFNRFLIIIFILIFMVGCLLYIWGYITIQELGYMLIFPTAFIRICLIYPIRWKIGQWKQYPFSKALPKCLNPYIKK